MAAEVTGGVTVFSPGLRLTVTVETGPRGEEIHLHPGGQGYWLARSMERLGVSVVLCATVGGEVGEVLTPLLRSHTGIELVAVEQAAPSPVTMYDRRSGTRTLIARSEPAMIDRHAVDKLYSLTLAHAIGRKCCVLAGNVDTGMIPASYYGRLGADLNTVGVPVIADLHGPELDEILDKAAVQLVKVSDEDLRDDGAISDDLVHGLVAAVNRLADRTSHDLVVTRGPDRPAVARVDDRWYRVAPPRLAAVDWRGAGDAMAGAMAVGYARDLTGAALLRFGAAAGAASVTRRGLASLDAPLVDALVPQVRVDEADGPEHALRSGHVDRHP
jgi:1-phosphofructokinase